MEKPHDRKGKQPRRDWHRTPAMAAGLFVLAQAALSLLLDAEFFRVSSLRFGSRMKPKEYAVAINDWVVGK